MSSKNLFQFAKSGGVVSILTKGYGGAMQRLTQDGQYTAAQRLQKTNRMVNSLGHGTCAFSGEQLISMCKVAGGSVLQWSGVRILGDRDRRPISKVGQKELGSILRLEQELGADPTIRGIGQMLHIICSKN